jgi:TetR/AcrR family transcriptional regulator, ethionamide resistance regulator
MPETITKRPPSPRLAREQSRRRIIDAATALLRERPYAKLSVGEIMERADIGRTIFYRHFDDLGELLLRVGREAIDELYEAQLALASIRVDYDAQAVREALALPVAVYHRHGPVLRGATEAAASDELLAGRQEELRRRFDGLVADALRRVEAEAGVQFANVDETARALNLLSHSYLLDAFGREPRISPEVAAGTLSEIWIALITPSAARSA